MDNFKELQREKGIDDIPGLLFESENVLTFLKGVSPCWPGRFIGLYISHHLYVSCSSIAHLVKHIIASTGCANVKKTIFFLLYMPLCVGVQHFCL